MKRKTTAILVSLLALLFVGLVMAQPRGGQRGGQQGDRPDFRNMSQEERQKFMEDRRAEQMKEQLEINDAEWTAMKPYFQKVTDLMRQSRGGGGRGGMMGGRGRGGRGPVDTPNAQPQNEAEKANEALGKLLESENPSNDEIKVKLAALRAARAKAEQELIKAQGELRQLLTLKQEAILVRTGVLK